MDKLDSLLEQWQSRESTVKSNLISPNDDRLVKQVIDVLNDLKSNLVQLDELGEQHDYSEEIKYNGFRSFAKITSSAIDRFKGTLEKQSKSDRLNEPELEKGLSFLKFINKLNTILLETYAKNKTLVRQDVNQNRKEHELLFDEKMTSDLFEQFFSMKEELKVYFDGHLSFYLTNQLQILVRIVSNCLLMLSYFPFSLFILFSRKRAVNALSEALVDSTVTWPGSIEIVNKPVLGFIVNLIATFCNGIKSQTIFIPKQQKWSLKTLDECNQTATDRFFNYRPTEPEHVSRDLKKDGIRVKLIHHSSKPKDGIVMFHVHGGK